MDTDQKRRSDLERFERWLTERYRRRGWQRVLVQIEDLAAAIALALLAVLLAR